MEAKVLKRNFRAENKSAGMRMILLLALLGLVPLSGRTQHCPWDCAGLVLLETDLPQSFFYYMHPALISIPKGVNKDSALRFHYRSQYDKPVLSWPDFKAEVMKGHPGDHSYRYDTLYHFAAGRYLVRFNFCEAASELLFIRFMNPYSRGVKYHYIEVPDSARISLCRHNNWMSGRLHPLTTEAMVQAFVWKLNKEKMVFVKEVYERRP